MFGSSILIKYFYVHFCKLINQGHARFVDRGHRHSITKNLIKGKNNFARITILPRSLYVTNRVITEQNVLVLLCTLSKTFFCAKNKFKSVMH